MRRSKLSLGLALALVLFVGSRVTQLRSSPYPSLKAMSSVIESLASIKPAYASGPATQDMINFLRNSIGMIVGYGSHAAYVSLVCGGVDPGAGGNCQGPPETGILGGITTLVNYLPTIAQSAGITSCQNAPASGTVTGTDSTGAKVALTFSSPTHKIPGFWLNGGTAFQHRVSFSETFAGTAVKIAVEFNCGDNAPIYTVISMPVGSNAPGFNRDINLYNGPVDASNNGIEVFFTEHNGSNAAEAREAHTMRIVYNPTTSSFQLWGVTQSNLNLSNQSRTGSVKTFLNGNYSTGVASAFLDGIFYASTGSTNDINTAAIDSTGTVSTSDAVGTTPSFDFTGDLTTGANGTALGNLSGSQALEISRQGCLNFSTPDTALTANTLCSGLSLAAATSAPALDASGKFSIQWATETLPTLVEHLP